MLNSIKSICLTSLLLFFVINASVFAQSKSIKPLKNIELRVQMSEKENCVIDTLRLYSWTGVQVEEFTKAPVEQGKNGAEFVFQLKNLPFGNYYLGRIVNNTMSDLRPVVLGSEDKVELYGSCSEPQKLTVQKSNINIEFEKMIDSMKTHGNEFVALLTAYQQSAGNKSEQEIVIKQLGDIDFRRKALLNRYKKDYPELAATLGLYTYLSFQNNQKSPNQSEGQYLAESFFQFVDLQDTNYVRCAFFYEAVKGYASNLSQVKLNADQVKSYLDNLLAKIGEKKPHHRPALLASAFGVMNSDKKLFLFYAEKYMSMYKGDNQVLDNFLMQQIMQLKSSTEIGDEAPDFSAATPEGGTLSLKSLRGKVVLVDFWASWCGPCRRENPNVVAVYNKYKEKGFDVLGVSLDRDEARWKQAIEQDKLTWNHVSDLGGWGSAPAKLYKVSSIPQTLLLDRNGIIIAKNLRGGALEQKLKEIFGE